MLLVYIQGYYRQRPNVRSMVSYIQYPSSFKCPWGKTETWASCQTFFFNYRNNFLSGNPNIASNDVSEWCIRLKYLKIVVSSSLQIDICFNIYNIYAALHFVFLRFTYFTQKKVYSSIVCVPNVTTFLYFLSTTYFLINIKNAVYTYNNRKANLSYHFY